jgi:hypothetical protein
MHMYRDTVLSVTGLRRYIQAFREASAIASIKKISNGQVGKWRSLLLGGSREQLEVEAIHLTVVKVRKCAYQLLMSYRVHLQVSQA